MENIQRIDVDNNTVLWKYMKLSRFLSMISTHSLYFARADSLKSPFEGVIHYNNFKKIYKEENINNLYPKNVYTKSVFINSWTKKNEESQALWNLYSDSDFGIAVKSTVGKLADFLSEFNDIKFYIGAVHYFDESPTLIFRKKCSLTDEQKFRFLVKDISDSFENEVRCFYINEKRPKTTDIYKNILNNKVKGTYLKGDLNKLISEIVILPKHYDFFKDIFENMVKNKYNLDKIDIKVSDYLNYNNE